MKSLLAILVMLVSCIGCATSAPVKVIWTYPIFNAEAPGTCISSADSLKDLAKVEVWTQCQGQIDSLLVLSRSIPTTQAGKPDSVMVNQLEGSSLYWIYLFDLTGNRSCASNVAVRTIIQPPVKAIIQ